MKIVAGIFLAHPTHVEQLMRELLCFFTKYNQDLGLTLFSPALCGRNSAHRLSGHSIKQIGHYDHLVQFILAMKPLQIHLYPSKHTCTCSLHSFKVNVIDLWKNRPHLGCLLLQSNPNFRQCHLSARSELL